VLVLDPKAEACRWIFAYGSLMWRPGFEFEQKHPAKLTGFHRRLSVYSYHYRGTPKHPGLVFGLDQGGACEGLAYQVAGENWQETLRYVRERELITEIYHEVVMPVAIAGQTVEAVTYVVDRQHEQYAAPKSITETLAMVRQGHGISGSCVEYVINTAKHLKDMGVHDAELEALARELV
jgi:glutathione-specific gamma-glutamylcyclotransferase